MKQDKLYFIRNINGKECRIYNEGIVSPVQAFYSELEVYFNQCINEGYNIYVLNNKPTHNIVFDNNDINYISTELYIRKKNTNNYYFSENLKYIKENQLEDFKWLLYKNELDFLFCIPDLGENNKYYYNFIIGLKDANKINNIIEHKFNLIELNNLQYLDQMLFDMNFLQKLFKIKNIENENTITTIFKDNGFTEDESDSYGDGKGKYFLYKKYNNICLKKLCFHFYYDNSIYEMCAYTDFLELTGGSVTYNKNDDLKVKSIPYPVSFTDLITHNDEVLFFLSREIRRFHWTKIDREKNHLSFLIDQAKNFDWDEPNQELLDWKKSEVKKCNIRLKEYRKLLKDNNKKLKLILNSF